MISLLGLDYPRALASHVHLFNNLIPTGAGWFFFNINVFNFVTTD